ncbi:DUF3291 domain-containing protein [Actinocorallia populi]|uniref:DUF3291 domain-containing protein n=1 Tax=Actinocorallia populi TaxID=2079200 RepID=UPI000D08AA30|nr:DUF3291 domain-containing protein [Actinocorallia populi]
MQLAQYNIARLAAPLADAANRDFVANLDRVNALADESPGFVWRLVDEAGDGTFHPYDDHQVIVTMSVWESRQALFDFTYRSGHLEFLRRRREWFGHSEAPTIVLWWVPDGHVPTVEEGKARLELLRAQGPTPEAFTFREDFEPAAVR